MPHQCLSCGFAFEDGSSALLQGCPECKGTRFFYTAKPIDDAERQEIQTKAKSDLREVVADMLQGTAPEAVKELRDKADADGWAELKPKDLRKLVKQVQSEVKADKGAAGFTRDLPPDQPLSRSEHARRRAEVAEAAKEMLTDAAILAEDEPQPDTVTIREPGDYEIDVKGLLEKEPIVVQKDGAYMIHLPSLFQKKD